jgi:ABC-type nitrate/sulfonate/bicarbonate transport system substrate-binding protein
MQRKRIFIQPKRHQRKRSWRRLAAPAVVAVAAVMTLTAVTACGSSGGNSANGGAAQSDGSLTHVVFDESPSSFTSLPQYVGIDMGYFKKYGIDATPLTSGSTPYDLLISHQVDFGATDIPATILASKAAKTDFRVAVGMEHVYPAALVCRKGIGVTSDYPANVKQLVGKKIEASGPTSQDMNDLTETLNDAGYQDSAIHVQYMSGGPSAIVAALDSGQIDCGMVYEPTQTKLGNTVVTAINFEANEGPSIIAKAPFNCLDVLASYAQSHPAVIADVQRAMTAIDAYISDPANATAIAKGVAKDFPGTSQSTLTALIRKLAPTYKDGATITKSGFDADVQIFNRLAANQVAGVTQPLTNVNFSDWILPMH